MEEQIKYDFSKCNNLSFKIKKYGGIKEGFLKVDKDKIYVYFNDETIFSTAFEMEFKKCDRMLPIASFNEWAEENELEIIPRDSETYNDWKVGVVFKYEDDKIGRNGIIMARFGEIIIFSDESGKYVYTMSAKYITENYKLVLTNYEQELLKEQEQKKYSFKKGDKVIVRDFNSNKWGFAIFELYNDELYYVQGPGPLPLPYRQCILFNEHTWQLLGTTDEYKEKK